MARANDIRAETVILAIKAGWQQLPESRDVSRMDAEATLAEVVTLCIKEYYAPQRNPLTKGQHLVRTQTTVAIPPLSHAWYRTLSSHLLGSVAEIVREAEGHQRDGNLAAAACLLEQGLEQATVEGGETPAWLCGRLASLYRSLQRYDDEVALLERHGESQASEETRARFRARLSKARAIADRCRKTDTGALRTVRDVQTRSRGRRRHSGAGQSSLPIASSPMHSGRSSPFR